MSKRLDCVRTISSLNGAAGRLGYWPRWLAKRDVHKRPKPIARTPSAMEKTAMQDHIFAGHVTGLVIFSLPEFGTRARFTIEDEGGLRLSVLLRAMSSGSSSLIIQRATGWSSAGFMNLGRPLPPTIPHRLPDFGYATYASRRTPVSRREAAHEWRNRGAGGRAASSPPPPQGFGHLMEAAAMPPA